MGTDELASLVEQLVAVPVNDAEREAGDRLEAWLREETDAEVRRDDAGNVFARKGSGDPSLALVGHHDVVDPEPEQVANGQLSVREVGGRLHGRGTADMKGALAAMGLAFRDASPDRELLLASFAGEERGGVGARAAIDAGFAPDYALVGEGSASYSAEGILDVAVGHKGRLAHTVHVSGTSAHASQPENGDNAIYRAADVVDRLRELDAPTASIAGTPVSGSLAVTGIEGGTDWNVIPADCAITVDERTIPGERAAVESLKSDPRVKVTVEQDLPPMACDEESFVEQVVNAAERVQSGSPEQVVKPHATDAGWLAAAGTTCLVCGPAEPGAAHSADESVSLDLLDRSRRLYTTVADGWNGP